MINALQEYCKNNFIHIIIEGCDATGKTTFIHELYKYLWANDIYSVKCKQPTTEIVDMYLQNMPKHKQLPEEMMALFVADGIALRSKIYTMTNDVFYGGIILQDRHVAISSYAYQFPQMKKVSHLFAYQDVLKMIDWKVCDTTLCFITSNEPYVQREEMHSKTITEKAYREYAVILWGDSYSIPFPKYELDTTNTELAIKTVVERMMQNVS